VKSAATVVALALLLSVPAGAQQCDEQVTFETGPGTIQVSHRQSMYNCCCEISFDVATEGYAIDITEYEELIAGGCDCLCCFDLEVQVSGLAPGIYTVRIVKNSEYGGEEVVGEWSVSVTGASDPAVRTAYVPCAASGADDETTWGVIKALYR